MKNLISNVFTIECFAAIYENITKTKDKTSYKWKNLMKSYPLMIKRFHIKRNLLTESKTCATIGGMYFFWFLSQAKYSSSKSILELFLQERQSVNTIEDFLLYESESSSCIFRELIGVFGNEGHLISTEPFNKSLVRLIEEYTIIPVTTENGIIWDLASQDSDKSELSELENILLEYSGWLNYNEPKRTH
jgi:hypothetical protein